MLLSSKKQITKLLIITVLLFIFDITSKYFFYDMQMRKGLVLIDPSFNFGIARSIGFPLIMTIIISFIALIMFIISYFRGYINVMIA